MSRLLSGRRPSSGANNFLKKSQPQRVQNEDGAPPAAAQIHTPPAAASITNKVHEKQASGLIIKLENKLPCNSGHALSAVEGDQVMEHVVVGLVQLSAASPDYIVWSLCRLLEKLQKRALPNNTLPEDVLDSQLYVLKTLTRVLNARWMSPYSDSDHAISPKSSTSLGHSHFPSTPSGTSFPQSPSSHPLPHIPSRPHIHKHPSNKPSQSSFRSDSTSVSWIEPLPLDDATARYALSVALIFLRDDFNGGLGGGSQAVREIRSVQPGARANGSMFAWDAADWEPALAAPMRAHKRRDKDPANPQNLAWEQTALPVQGASDVGTFGRGGSAAGGRGLYTMYAHEYARDMALHGSYLASVAVLVTKYAGRIVFNLSASNWPVVFTRIRDRLRVMADDKDFAAPAPSSSKAKDRISSRYMKSTSDSPTKPRPVRDENDDCVELRLLSVCVIDRMRLTEVLQDFSTLFITMPPFAQDVACIALRAAVLNWVDNFPRELTEMWTSTGPTDDLRKRRLMDGFPERVFDMLHDTSNQMKRAAWLYPTLASLISISPERLESSVEAIDGSTKVSKKNNFLKQLSNAGIVSSSWSANATTILAEHAAIAHLDIVRAAFAIPPAAPGGEEPTLRTIGVQLAHELKRFMLHPPPPLKAFYEAMDPIDVNFYAYCIVAVFRFHPEHALEVMQICLEPQRSAAVKLVVVKALVLIVVEATKYPWQPRLDITFPVITPRMRSVCIALLAGRSEIFKGITRPASTFPQCKSIIEAARLPDLLSEIDEDVRLLVHIETLFTLAPEYWLYGTTDEDHGRPLDDAKSMLGPTRDKRAKAATMMGLCAMLTRALNITPDTAWYPEGMRYLWYTIPTALVSVPLLLLSAGGNDHEFHRTGAACLHTLLMHVAEGSPYEQDDSWRFSKYTMGAMPLVELALWTALSSSQMDISTAAQRCLRLVSVIERNPALAPPEHLTSEEFSKRCTVLEGLGDPRALIVGRVAFQKRICKHISMMSFPSPIHVMMFRQFFYRWTILTPKVDYARHGPGTAASTKDELNEWHNKMCILAVAGGYMLIDEALPFPADLDAILPAHLQGFVRPADLVRRFLVALVALLSAETLTVRALAKEAVGNELSMRLFPLFFEIMNEETDRKLSSASGSGQSTLIFVEQLLAVMKMIFGRIDGYESIFKNTAGEQTLSVAKHISTQPSDLRTFRLRTLFSATVDVLLSKRHLIAIRYENTFRNSLVEILAGWIAQKPSQAASEEPQAAEYYKAAMEAHIAVLKTFVRAVETLHIDPSENTASENPQMVSRQFHRYLSVLVNTLVPINVQEFADSTSEFDKFSTKSGTTHNNEALINELVVTGIAHLLNNNIEAGMKHCLALCYDDDFHLRVILMKAFARVLNLGTKFDPQQVVSSNEPQVALCELLRDCEMILSSFVEACSPGDVDKMVPVLLHVFNTRTSIVNLVKLLIDREVSRATTPMQLFRGNDLCSRLLSAFARQHGYIYLRSILVNLIETMMQRPMGCSFELDPSKLPLGEDPAFNAQTLIVITQAFIQVIVDSVETLPPVLREICYHMGKVVSASWPESKYVAIGAFLFLRFLCPAIVAPETVDIELSRHDPRSPSIRRGLMLVAKIIQNLANNVSFVKEKFLVVLNPFLEKNVRAVNKYLSTASKLMPPAIPEEDQNLGPASDGTDSLVLHRFFQAHMDKIGKQLLGQMEPVSGRSKFASGKDAWDALCSQLVEMGTALEPPNLSREDSSGHSAYLRFIGQNQDRNADTLRDIFAPHPSIEGQAFVFTFAKIDIDIIDFELLIYSMFKAIEAVTPESDFDVVFDFTAFTSRSELPVAWLRLALELLPNDFRERWRSAYILNLDGLSQVFLRKVLYIFADLSLARQTIAVSSVAELQEHLGQGFMATSYPATLEYQKVVVYEDVHQQMENQSWNPVCLYVGDQHLRIVSVKAQQVSPSLSSRITEVIHLREVEDAYKGPEENHLVIRQARRGPSITLMSSTSSEQILKALQAAKQRASTFKPALLPTSQISDLSATLLAIGMLHACHQDEYVRGAAYGLLTANCSYMRYPFDAQVPWRGSFIPANSLAFIINFSERISTFAPHITIDFIYEWSRGFSDAEHLPKITCLQYMSPWLHNLSSCFDPNSPLFDVSGTKVRECIHIFVEITMEDHEVYPVLQRAVWMRLGKSTSNVVDIVIDELIRVAVDSGHGSRRCELVADTLIALSSIHTRAKVINELRKQLSRACGRPTRSLTEAMEWKAISALSRLVLVAGHTSRLATDNQLYAPEIAHLVTMLAATGSLTMRSSIYGMAVNLLQSLHVARAEDEAVAIQLRALLDDMSSPEYLKLFGLNRRYPSSEISLLEPISEQICVESLEKITSILLRSLELGSASDGLQNVWEARWMSLVTSMAFQSSFHSQSRAFMILGSLAGSAVDDDILFQMLTAFRTNLLSSHDDSDMTAALSMLRCMRKAIPGLPADSRYLGLVFWLAISVIQAGCTPCYGEAVQLLQASVETMDRHAWFRSSTSATVNPMQSTLMEARIPLLEAALGLDEISGLSFETDFGFALVSSLWRGVRVRPDIELLRDVLRTLLTAAVRAANPEGDQCEQLDGLCTPLFIGLAPCLGREEYARMLEVDFHVANPFRDFSSGDEYDGDEAFRIRLDALTITDATKILLATGFLLSLDVSYILDAQDKENVHFYWAEIAKSYPDLFTLGVFHFMEMSDGGWISQKMETLFSSSSPAHLHAITTCFDIVMSRGAYSTPEGTPTASSTSLGFEGSIVQPAPQFTKDGTFSQMLSEIGMIGAVQPFRAPSSAIIQRTHTLQCVPEIVRLILQQ